MERALELRSVIMLLLFLRISIYYRIKLLSLSNVIFSYVLVEKSYIGIFRVGMISFIIIFIINVYLSLVFSLRLELISFKLVIYLLIFCFFF